MEHQQSAQGFETTVILLSLVAIVIVVAFYLSFIRKNKEVHSGH